MTATPEIMEIVTRHPEPTADAAVSAPTLITEQEVALSTAAALSGRATVASRRRIFARSTGDRRKLHRDRQRRYAFLEDSCMARAMDRL